MKKKLVNILLLLILATFLGYLAKREGFVLGTRADVVGSLFFTYPGGPTPETLFNEGDFKPGDCKTASVNVKNNGIPSAIVGVFSDGETESDGLSSALNIEISDDTPTVLYGPVTLAQFFADSNIIDEIELLSLAGGTSTNLHFKVCFPNTDDNELQGDQVVFDLKFGHIPQHIELPPECSELEGIVTEIVEGTEGDDNIHASTAPELILAKGGNDKVDASSSSDCVVLGDGNDYIRSESGNDIVLGGNGNDKIISGSGNDTVYGGPGNDNISTGSGADKAYGGEGDDKISTGSGNDYADGESGVDNISGGSGTDTCLNEETASSCEF